MTGDALEIHSVPTMTHGRVLVAQARAAAARGLLVGFHGYGENAGVQMERLRAIPGAAAWTLVSVQALHRFYDRRTEQVIASWMTHEDREDAIADNVAYVTAALESRAARRFTAGRVRRVLSGCGDGLPRGLPRPAPRRPASSRSAAMFHRSCCRIQRSSFRAC